MLIRDVLLYFWGIMEWILVVLAALLIIAGIGGCVLPIIPGPPIAFVGMLVLHFSDESRAFGFWTLVVYGLVAIAITVLDYFIPIYGTKKFGGTKYGTRGSIVGLIVGTIVLPVLGIVLGPFGLLGIILGPFAGAVVGEKIGGMENDQALKAGIGSFIGFLAGTLLKLVYCLVILYFFISSFF